MSTYTVENIINSTDRYKLYVLKCYPDELAGCIEYIKLKQINVINIGKELARFVGGLTDYRYLNIDACDFFKSLLEKHKTMPGRTGNAVLAIYNLGILMEQDLELKATQLLKDFSKSTSLILIWENESVSPDILTWSTQQNNYNFDFTDAQIKYLQYEI